MRSSGEDHIRPSRANLQGQGTPTPRAASRGVAATSTSAPFAVRVLYGAWFVFLFDIHFFLGNVVFGPLGKLGTAILVLLLVVLVTRLPDLVGGAKGWMWYPAYLMVLLSCFVTLPTAVAQHYARTGTQIFFVFYILSVATASIIKTARQAVPIVVMLFGQFAWWAINGRALGLIPWHPGLANYDGFGGLMVMGTALLFWCAFATRLKWLKWCLVVLAAYCVFGVVISFARGAFISLVTVACIIWVRSPRKVATAAWGIGGIALVLGASAILFPDGSFWAEMSTALDEGASSGTGGLRWTMWKAATRIFLANPIFGVGVGNFGAYASRFFGVGEIQNFPYPAMLYGMNPHNSYFQVLSELGLVGTIGFVWFFIDFQRRNRDLRAPDAVERWNRRTGGLFNLRYLALALEAANVANFMSGLFYASLLVSWFYTVWIVNRMLWAVTRPSSERDATPVTMSEGTGAPMRMPVRGGLRGPVVDPAVLNPPAT